MDYYQEVSSLHELGLRGPELSSLLLWSEFQGRVLVINHFIAPLDFIALSSALPYIAIPVIAIMGPTRDST